MVQAGLHTKGSPTKPHLIFEEKQPRLLNQHAQLIHVSSYKFFWESLIRNGHHGHRQDTEKKLKSLGHVRLFATLWTVAYEVPPSMEFSRQEYWSGLPFPSSGDLSNPGIEPGSPTLQADALPSEPPGTEGAGYAN